MEQPRLLFAPFKGLTGKLYRNAFSRHFGGIDFMYAPFISGVGQVRINPSKLTDVVPVEENLAPTVPQFISTDAREIILFGKTLQQHGYNHINWNMGCPFAHIADKKRGCGILPYPGELDRILDQVFSEFPIQLSIKTRLGYYNHEEIFRVIEVLNQYPISLLIIHARIGTQIYSGEVNLDTFSECLALSKTPIAYNGDIFHRARLIEMQRRFPMVNTWMLGRGALINPLLPLEIRGMQLSEAEKRQRLGLFLDEIFEKGLESATDQTRLLGYMKAVWFYIAGFFENPKQIFQAIKTMGSLSAYRQAAENCLEKPLSNEAGIEEYFRKGVKHLGS